MKVCNVCLKELTPDEEDNLFSFFHPEFSICFSCLNELRPVFKTIIFQDVELTYIYEYDAVIQNLLFLFKGQKDYDLKDIFLTPIINELKIKYHGYVLIPIPSSKEHENERGFSHIQEMFGVLKLPFIDILEKAENIKQSSLSRKKRWENRANIVYNGEYIKEGLKLLIVDDVMTTGATLTAALEIVRKFNPKEIKILIMSKKVKIRR